MPIKSNSLGPNDPRREFVLENAGAKHKKESDHSNALKLREILSNKLDKTALKQIDTIINNVILGPQKTERTDSEKISRANKMREEMIGLINTQSKRSEQESINEIIDQLKSLGIISSEDGHLVDILVEYSRLMYKLNSK